MAFEQIESYIELDLYDYASTPAMINAIALDNNARSVTALVCERGRPYDIGQNANVVLTIMRPDKTGAQLTGQTRVITGKPSIAPDTTIYGVYAELTQSALSEKGSVKAQFKITSGNQVLRTEIFTISTGQALDADITEWTDYQGYNLDELIQSVTDLSGNVSDVQGDVSDLKEDFNKLDTATASDIGKYLRAKSVADGKVTEWEFATPSGGGGSSINVDDTLTISGDAADAKATGDKINDLDSRVTDIELGGTSSIGEFLGNTPITLTEDANIKLVATQTTEYDLGSGTVADFSRRKNVTLQNVSLTVNNEYTEVAVTGEPSAWYSAYASMTFDGFQIGEEYTITIDPLGSQDDLIAGGTFYFLDTSETALADPMICMDEVVTQTFTATTTSITLQIYPVNSTYWDDNYRAARFKSMTISGRLKGSFNGTVALGSVAAGTTITATPSCKVYAVEDTSVYKSRHAGKVCVCFGDSVTGFMSPPNDYPSVLAQLTGMTVYNVGFGGCRMSDTHPYEAYKRFGMCALVDAIVSGNWTEQDQYVDQIEAETFPQVHLNTLKRIDWNSVDFVTIFYGGNDAGNDVAIGTAGSSDTQTMVGALKYSVEKLLTAYPHLKILVLTQIFRYWMSDNKDSEEMEFTMGGQTYHYYDWGDEEIKAAQLLKVPVVDMYRTLGINSITRTLYLRASDQTHPSAEGNRLIAGKIAGKLLSEY